jgi:UDPglucose 6-dehydrogenase
MFEKIKIAVIGTGYVGLVTGVCLASRGFEVTCIDNNKEKIELLKKGECPIFEPGLSELMVNNYEQGRLSFSLDTIHTVQECNVIFLCLPTPAQEDGSADLSYVMGVCEQIAPHITETKIIVNKSTVPVGTTDIIQNVFDTKCSTKILTASNPEFLREGFAVSDFLNPDRIVIGSDSQIALGVITNLYQKFVSKPEQILTMDTRSSEMSKYAANSFLATKISFINETANLCEQLGANVDSVAHAMGLDPRIGGKFLQAGIGYGGSCFPKDVKALNSTSTQLDYKFEILQAVIAINYRQKRLFVDKILHYYNRMQLHGVNLAVWGLAFKANTDDIRDSAAIEIIKLLIKKGANIKVYDPEAVVNTKKMHPNLNVQYCSNMYQAVEEADGLLILTDWEDFKEADFVILAQKMKHKVIFDGRNIWKIDYPTQKGFKYLSVGR